LRAAGGGGGGGGGGGRGGGGGGGGGGGRGGGEKLPNKNAVNITLRIKVVYDKKKVTQIFHLFNMFKLNYNSE
jgi:hypothetical protein